MLLNSALELHQTEVKNMANNKNHIKKRYYPLRDAENPYKVSLVEITEVQYRALYPEIWSTQSVNSTITVVCVLRNTSGNAMATVTYANITLQVKHFH